MKNSILLALLAILCAVPAVGQTRHEFQSLRSRGYRISVRRYDARQWERLVRQDPLLPRTIEDVRRMERALYGAEAERSREECGEERYGRFYSALGNPALTDADLGQVEADLTEDLPELERSYETPEGHFVLRWTETNAVAAHNIADPAIVHETGAWLEAAWAKYVATFALEPYVPAGQTRMEVVFHDLAGSLNGKANPPEGPLHFDAPKWVSTPGIRKPTSAHELFHKLQYAFGYKTNPLAEGGKWFTEGTASWAEVFVWDATSAAPKLTTLFAAPDTDLMTTTHDVSGYLAQPFWIFFESRLQTVPGYQPMATFFQKYQATGKVQASLVETIAEDGPAGSVYFADLDSFFALFARERRLGTWRQTPSGATLHAKVVNSYGKLVVPALAATPSILAGGTAVLAGSVSALGADYHVLDVEAGAAFSKVVVDIDAADGAALAYHVVLEKDGQFVEAHHPFQQENDAHLEFAVAPGAADRIVVILSGRETGGDYQVSVKIE